MPPPGMEAPEPKPMDLGLHLELPRSHVAEHSTDLPGPPRWKKILAVLFRVSTVAAPAAGAGYVAAHVQMAPQKQEAPASLLLVRSEAGKVLDSANIDKLIPIVVVIVPEDNTEARRAESKSILEQGVEYIKSLPGEVLLGTLKDGVKDSLKLTLVGAPMLALARFLLRRSRESGNKLVGWLGEAAEKIADLFGKHEARGAITTEQLNQIFGGEKVLAAETLLLIAGYKKVGDEWLRTA